MKNRRATLIAGLLALGAGCFAVGARAQGFQAPTQAPWLKPADNRIHAQAVVNRLMAANPELVSLGLHSVPPGVLAQPNEVGQIIVAQVSQRIGAPDGAGDLEVGKLEQVKIYKAKLDGVTRMRVMAPLLDAKGRNIGLVVMLFKLEATPTALSAHMRADAVIRELQQEFVDQASLFTPAA